MAGMYDTDSLNAHFAALGKRLDYIEAQLEHVARSAGTTYALWSSQQGVPDDVAQLARSGDKLGAMKRYREVTGATFEQARDAIAGL